MGPKSTQGWALKTSGAPMEPAPAQDWKELFCDGRARLDAGDLDGAVALLARAVELDKAGEDDAQALLLNELGQARYRQVDFDEAIEAYTLAIARSPAMAVALFNRGQVQYRLGRVDAARADLEAATASLRASASAGARAGASAAPGGSRDGGARGAARASGGLAAAADGAGPAGGARPAGDAARAGAADDGGSASHSDSDSDTTGSRPMLDVAGVDALLSASPLGVSPAHVAALEAEVGRFLSAVEAEPGADAHTDARTSPHREASAAGASGGGERDELEATRT